jgi:hypothetical protein
MPTYLYGLRDGAPAVLLYTESEAVLHPPGLPVVGLRQETGFPSDGAVTLYVQLDEAVTFPLHLRIPPYADGALARVVGQDGLESDPVPAQAGDYLVIERQWAPGDAVKLSLPFELTCRANEHAVALIRGPLTYAYFQDAQADPVIFHRRRGLYPEDVVLHVDPGRLQAGVRESPAGDGLVGPALRVAGRVRARAPMFASSQANAQLPEAREQSVILLPFVNQGAIRGEYGVFMAYARSEE